MGKSECTGGGVGLRTEWGEKHVDGKRMMMGGWKDCEAGKEKVN